MTATPFAALERRLSAAVFARLANASVSIDYAEPFAALFDNDHHVADVGIVGMASTRPILVAPVEEVPLQPVGRTALVDGVAYLIAAVEPDGAGSVRILLEAAL